MNSIHVMRKHGFHRWTDTKRNQGFWCLCSIGKDHRGEPVFKEPASRGTAS